MAWAKLGTETNTGTSDPIILTLTTANTFNVILQHHFISGSVNSGLRAGSTTIDTGSNYASRESFNGGADSTRVSQSGIFFNLADPDEFDITYMINISGEEKLLINFGVGNNASGSANAPARNEVVGKWTNTSNQFDIIETNDLGGAGSYLVDSNISALGSDGVESITVQDGAVYYDTDLNKEYVLYNNTWTEV
jgi:hypothetical protein